MFPWGVEGEDNTLMAVGSDILYEVGNWMHGFREYWTLEVRCETNRWSSYHYHYPQELLTPLQRARLLKRGLGFANKECEFLEGRPCIVV